MSDITEIQFELDQLAELIGHTHERLNANHLVDVSGLAERTEALCNRIAALPKENSITLEPGMRAIVDELDNLAEHISEQQQSLVEALAELEQDQPDDTPESPES
jgi:hypothetical protein